MIEEGLQNLKRTWQNFKLISKVLIGCRFHKEVLYGSTCAALSHRGPSLYWVDIVLPQ